MEKFQSDKALMSSDEVLRKFESQKVKSLNQSFDTNSHFDLNVFNPMNICQKIKMTCT